jgi:hypothetical protein
MLPKEMSKLYVAVNGSKEAQVDVGRLRSELAGMAQFHRRLLSGLMTKDQELLYSEFVHPHIDPRDLERLKHGVAITAPREGPPEVHLRITAPATGAPTVKPSAGKVRCPNCGEVFKP